MVVLDGMLSGTSLRSIPDEIQVVLDMCAGADVITIAITTEVIIITVTTEKYGKINVHNLTRES